MLSKGRNVPVTFFAHDSALEVVLFFRWGKCPSILNTLQDLKSRILVVLTPDAEDATYLNATEMAEVYKQSDNDNGLDMQVLQLPFDQELNARHAHYANKGGRTGSRSQPSNDQSDYIGEYGSNGESYEDFSVYS
ncbi:hypothetical protein Y032_0326g2556 [Ancylostoma ceylanicum]|uniref:Uncharacterized protein n=3 Tax=Ancylostoma ceylanicum TaxID=53326 RepID=A0A016S0Q5_9BILA|nr:hypothetical protein Y032_0326g2556 [Ancylostoma ceylanicum]